MDRFRSPILTLPPHSADWLGRAWHTTCQVEPIAAPAAGPPDRVPRWHRALLAITAPAMELARREADAALAAAPPATRDACRRWLDTPPPSLVRLLAAAVVPEIQAARALADPGQRRPEDNWFDRHLAGCTGPAGRAAFFARHPVLERLVCARLQHWRDAAVEFAVRLERDWPAIAALLGADAPVLTEVAPGLGDPHRGHRAVARVAFDAGAVAYKPRPVRLLVGLRALVDALAGDHGVELDVRLPAAIDRGDYGWLTWIEAAPCDGDGAVERYYRRLGELHALAWAIGADDLHSDNVVAAGDAPCLIDVETLLTPVAAHAGMPGDDAELLSESPLTTGILPAEQVVGDGSTVDHSAFGDHPDQLTPEVTTWDAPGTSDMAPVRRRMPYRHPASVPRRSDGASVDAFRHAGAFVEGARRGFAALARASDALARGPLVERVWRGARTRVVLRDTVEYGLVNAALRDPGALADPGLAEAAFDRLQRCPVHRDPAIARGVFESERRAVLRGDIPYFEVDAAGRALVGCDGTTVPEYFLASPIDRVRSRAARLAGEQPALVWATVAAVRGAELARSGARRTPACATPGGAAPDAGVLVRAAAAIGRRLCGLACASSAGPAWLTLRPAGDPGGCAVTPGERWRVASAGDALYDGRRGVLLFLETLCAITDPGDDVRRVRAGLRAWWASSDPDAACGAGVFDGLAGDLYLTARLTAAAAIDAGAAGRRLARLIVRLADAGPPLGVDVRSGAAGVLLALCRVQGPQRAAALDVAAAQVEPVLAAAADGRLPEGSGFGRGAGGVAYALGELAAALRPRHAELATRCLAALPAPRCGPGRARGWCDGASGAGLAHAAVLRRLAGDDPRRAELATATERAIRASLDGELGRDPCLCHGELGAAEALLVAAGAIDRPAWRAAARAIGGAIAADAIARDGVVIAELGGGIDLPGLMTGAAGAGYQLLRLAAPHAVPSILLLEASCTSS